MLQHVPCVQTGDTHQSPRLMVDIDIVNAVIENFPNTAARQDLSPSIVTLLRTLGG